MATSFGLVMDPQQTSQDRSHVFFFPFNFLSKVILSIIFLIDMSFFTSINVIFSLLYLFSIPQLESTHYFSPMNRSPLNMTKPSRGILPHLFINRGHPYL